MYPVVVIRGTGGAADLLADLVDACMEGDTPRMEALFARDGLHPEWWGVSKAQLRAFVGEVRAAQAAGVMKNPTEQEAGKFYYPQDKFDDPKVGPTLPPTNAHLSLCTPAAACLKPTLTPHPPHTHPSVALAGRPQHAPRQPLPHQAAHRGGPSAAGDELRAP